MDRVVPASDQAYGLPAWVAELGCAPNSVRGWLGKGLAHTVHGNQAFIRWVDMLDFARTHPELRAARAWLHRVDQVAPATTPGAPASERAGPLASTQQSLSDLRAAALAAIDALASSAATAEALAQGYRQQVEHLRVVIAGYDAALGQQLQVSDSTDPRISGA